MLFQRKHQFIVINIHVRVPEIGFSEQHFVLPHNPEILQNTLGAAGTNHGQVD